eukprot:7882823-Ditylum_brightwellii.AAC.2
MESIIIAICQKKKDTVYTKSLLSAANAQGLFDSRVFIPYDIHIQEGAAFLKAALRKHNKYVKDIKCIAIEGMSLNSMWCKAPMEHDPGAAIAEHFTKHKCGIESLEKTQLTEEKCNWFLLYTRGNVRRVQYFVDRVLPHLYNDFVPESHRVPGYAGPY